MKRDFKTEARGWAVLALCVLGGSQLLAGSPIWAKAGVSLPVGCEESRDVQQVNSPDRTASVEVRCAGLSRDARGVLLRVRRGGRQPTDVVLDLKAGSYWRPQGILWAPDSSAFVINGSESAYAGNDFVVYRLGGDPITLANITAATQRDMVATFPPCKAAHLDRTDCRRIAEGGEFNMSAIAWVHGSSRLVVFAEVPCSSSYGGIMCQVMGYEVEVATGEVAVRMDARELKRRYQSKMAWSMRIPYRPSYK